MCQTYVSDMDKEKREMEQSIMRKDTEINSLNSRLGDEQGNIGRVQRSIKELTGRINQLEDELEAERQARAKAEKQRSEFAREYDELKDRLEENSMATESQKELNKKRENEIAKMKKDIEENCIQHEATVLSLKKKHQEAVSELLEQIDQLAKMKAKFEKDKVPLKMQLDDSKVALDHIQHERALIDKNLSNWEGQLKTIEGKIAELGQQLSSSELQNKRITIENSEMFTRLEEMLNNVSILQKSKIFLTGQLDEAKQGHKEEVKERQALLSRYRNTEIEYSGVRDQLDDATQQKEDSIRMLNKVSNEANTWRLKFENDAIAKIEEHEAAKLKLQARLNESESTIENLNNKLVIMEKNKFMNEKNIEDAKYKVDQASARHGQAEKRVKTMDRSVNDWKRKADDIAKELASCQMEQRSVASELFRVKNGKSESDNQLEEILKENKGLADEIKNLMEQISDGGRTVHEIDKKRKRLEAEKKDLEGALGDAETALEFEENKLLKLTLDINQLKTDIDKRIKEKEEDFECTKKNHCKAMEQLQFAIEEESKSKAESIRMKKKLEMDMNDLEGSLKRSTLENTDLHVLVRRQQESLKSKTEDIETSRRDTDMIRDYLITAERKVSSLKNAVEETRSMLEQSDKFRRQIEQDLSESNDEQSKLVFQNTTLDQEKRKLESDLVEMQVELDEVRDDLKEREMKAKECMIDASKIAEELHNEQDQSGVFEAENKLMESKLKELQAKIEEAENSSLRNGKKMMTKVEERIRELVSQIDDEGRRKADALKNFKKADRGVKEYIYRANEDQKNSERIKDLIEKLQNQVRNYKKQLEEAEDIASNNLAKYKIVQKSLIDAQEQAGEYELELERKRGMSRGASLAREY